MISDPRVDQIGALLKVCFHYLATLLHSSFTTLADMWRPSAATVVTKQSRTRSAHNYKECLYIFMISLLVLFVSKGKFQLMSLGTLNTLKMLNKQSTTREVWHNCTPQNHHYVGLVARYLRASLTVINTHVGGQPAEVRGRRGSDCAQGVLLPLTLSIFPSPLSVT
jgi:hypothetical protein